MPPTDTLSELAENGVSLPDCLTVEDKRIMGLVDYLTLEMSKVFADGAMLHRQKILSALITARNGMN